MSRSSWRVPRRRLRVTSTLLGLALVLVPAFAWSRPLEASKKILVVYRDAGPHALEACAEDLFRRGQPMAASSADRSDSLDQWHQRHRVKGVRALFRHADGSSLGVQRGRMARRLTARAEARSAKGRGARVSESLRGRVAPLASAYAVELPADEDLATALAELRADPHVAYAQQDHAYALDYAPNDPYLATRGAWGQDYADLWGLDRIRVQQAWQTTRGAGQIVAVVDTGLDYTHPDIAANVWVNPGEDSNQNGVVDDSDWNGVDDDANGLVDDLRGYDFAGFGTPLSDGTFSQGDPDPFDALGHGTHVSGTIAAVADNGIGIAGVAPEARVMVLKGFDDEGNGRDSDLWTAVLYAIENGAGVVNASWSCSPACPDNPLARQVLAIAADAGVVFVTSAGNEGVDVVRNEPERTTAAITVGSLGQDDKLSIFSNRGWLVDLIAPGGGTGSGTQSGGERNILSLAARKLPIHEDFFRVGDAYYRLQGTSMAAPHVTGAVALLQSLRPGLTVDQVRRLLRISSRDLPPAGHDSLHGGGALDVARLLETPLPDLELAFVSPAPGAMHDPLSGPLEILVRAGGRDAESFSLARSPGLSSLDFEALDEWSGGDDGAHAFSWVVEAIEPGPQVLRLRATLATGEIVDEFSIVGLESIAPQHLSSGAFHEVLPDISGRRVVWEALTDSVPRRGQVVVGVFRRDGESLEPVVVDEQSERSQLGPRIGGQRVVWREGLAGTAPESLLGCVLFGSGDRRACARETLAVGPERLEPIAFRRGIALWRDSANGRDIVGCRWPRPGPCVPRQFGHPDPSRSSRLLAFDGTTLVWRSTDPAAPVGFCRLRNRDLTCEPSLVRARSSLGLTDSAGMDGNLLALELFGLNSSRLAHCQLDLETGDCDLRFVKGVQNARRPAVSGRRIVWTESPETEDTSIVYCEVDPIDGTCARKRLTGAPFPAGEPRVDQNRIVWEDERFGPTQILGVELPGLELVPRVRLRAGMISSVPIIRVGASAGIPWRFALEGISGLTPADLEARVVDYGRSIVQLSVRATASHAGQGGLWRIRATTPSGLETRSAIEIFVDRRSR